MKLIIEPSGAVPVAVVLSEAFKKMPGLSRVAVVVSGGNVAAGHEVYVTFTANNGQTQAGFILTCT